jgi:hypothetical protein
MSILGEQFEPWVQAQILVRQNVHGLKTRNNEQLNVLNNQNAWLKLGSSVKVTDNSDGRRRIRDLGLENTSQFVGIKLASKSVLFNTMSDLDVSSSKYTQRAGVTDNKNLWNSSNAYGLGGNQFGIVPAPGLISADIIARNRGSIREANVEIKANNKFQFELIELLYLRLGYSMLLEWGWNKYHSAKSSNIEGKLKTTGSTLMETYWFEQTETPFTDVLNRIDQQKVMLEGNYDGFLGKVVNFDWKFNPDGTYDITLKLITVGDVIESLKVNLPQTTATVGQVNASINANTTPVSAGLASANSTIITNAGDSTLSYDLYTDIVGDQDKFDGSFGGVKTGFLSLLGVVGDEINNTISLNPNLGTQPGAPLTPASNQGGNTMKYSFFLTFRELLAKIEKYCLPTINGDKILGINMGDDQICAIYPYQFSIDPRICFVRPFFLEKFSFNSEADSNAGDTGINNYSSWLQRVNNFGTKDKDAIYGNIMDIYLNYDFITNVLANETNNKGDIFLFKFLQKICDGVNDALGGINNIECILSKDREINFIEQNPISSIETSTKYGSYFTKDPVPFELYGYNPNGVRDPKTKELKPTSNFVREFGFNTKIDPQLSSMITIGATAEGKKTKNYDGTAFSKWNEGLEDRFSYKYDSPEEPPLVSVPSDISGEVSPLTLDQLTKISNAFDKSTLDLYKGIDVIDEWASPVFGWMMERPAISTTWGGLTKDGKRDIDPCPITNETYKNKSWSEYATKVRRRVIADALKNANQGEVKDDIVNYIAYCVRAFGGKENNTPITSPDYFKFDDSFIKLGKNSFKGWVNTISNKNYEKNKQPSNTIGFIPIDLNLKCDGLSGVKMYQQLAIRQEFLPRQYPRALKFIISKVNHSISNNDWTTELKTISTANVSDSKLTAETFKLVEYDLTDRELIYAATTFGPAGNLTVIPGVGGILSSGIEGDPAKIINPENKGSGYYTGSPLAKWFTAKGVTNGINEQIIPYLVDTGDTGRGKTLEKMIAHNGGNKNWLLAPAPAAAWARWKADATASGYSLTLTNGYRSQAYQASFGKGGGAADPGKSPHGWGGAVDIGIKEKTSGKLRHQIALRSDVNSSSFRYGKPLNNKTGEGALLDRLAEDWKIIALAGARYGFFNPERLADNTTPEKLKTTLDEAWHFEYWGPVEVGYTNPNAAAGGGASPTAANNFGWGGVAGPAGTTTPSQGANAATSYTAAKNIFWDFKKIFALTDKYGPNNQPLFKPAKGRNDNEELAKSLLLEFLDRSFIRKRFGQIIPPDNQAIQDFINKCLAEMVESSSANVKFFITAGTESGQKEYIGYINTNF